MPRVSSIHTVRHGVPCEVVIECAASVRTVNRAPHKVRAFTVSLGPLVWQFSARLDDAIEFAWSVPLTPVGSDYALRMA